MTSSTLNRVIAPDQSEKACKLITLMLTLDPEAQSHLLARLIAATLHGGKGTALHEFASSGTLDLERARDELNWVQVDTEQEDWADALGRYFYLWAGEPGRNATIDSPSNGVLRGQTANDAE
jgi:hypothetical protein